MIPLPDDDPNETAKTVLPVRDGTGRWAPRNRAAVGHGGSAHDLARWRRLALEATTEQDMREIWAKLVECAKAGEPWAVHEFLDRTMGKVTPAEPEQAEGLSESLARQYQRWLRPAEVVYGERLAALKEENARLKAAQPAAAFEQLQRQELGPASLGVRREGVLP